VAHDALRHRVIMNYEGQAEQISVDNIISEVLGKVEVP
jgi:MoxR-like ATPase